MNPDELHLFFFPLMAHGHMLPMLDTAKLFVSRGVKATFITTPANASVFTKPTDDQTNKGGNDISLHLIKFPAIESGLPEGCECIDKVTSPDMVTKFGLATLKLQKPVEQLLRQFRPHCLVADAFFPWASKMAAKLNIPILVFHVSSVFAQCVNHSMIMNTPFKKASSDVELCVIPNLPHEIKLTRLQVDVHEQVEEENGFTIFLNERSKSEVSSYGVIFNSFYELEPEYADHYRKVLKRNKTWLLGPVSLCNRKAEDKAQRGKKPDIGEHECMKWLDSKKPNSVIYVCFGSSTNFAYGQLKEIACGIEESEQDFIWVVRKRENEEWLPEGFEERTKGKGLIVTGWAPQVLILDHEAIGAFVTHCGWNSTLEGVSAGVPMVTCPFFAEQFYNEKLVTDVLRSGVSAGVEKFSSICASEVVLKRDGIAKAVKRIMLSTEGMEIRSRAKALKDKAKMAVDHGGSSYSSLTALVEQLIKDVFV